MRSDCSTLDSRAFALAAGTVAAAISAICAAALAIAPGATRTLGGYLIHSDLSSVPPTVTWGSFVVSVVGWGLIAGITFFAAAGLYNRVSGTARTAGREIPARGFA